MANFTPQEIEEMLQEFFSTTGKRQYVGARYVPIFGRAGSAEIDWDNSNAYEPLTIVLHNGDSYTSRRYVPAGIDISNADYWVITGRYNAQVEQYRQEVLSFQGQIDGIRNDLESDYVPFPDSDHFPKYGILGQVLTTLSNGETKWENPVVPSDAQAEEVITEWLNDHPEATTTVQDGAVSWPKLGAGAVNRILHSSNTILEAATVSTWPFDDANNQPPNSMYFIQDSVTSGMLANLTEYNTQGLLVKFCHSSVATNGFCQLYITYKPTRGMHVWLRMNRGSYTSWMELYPIDDAPYLKSSGISMDSGNVSTWDFNDANNQPPNSVYFVQDSITSELLPNLPEYNTQGILTKINYNKTNVNGFYQIYTTYKSTRGMRVWVRMNRGSYTDWNRIYPYELDLSLSTNHKTASIFRKVVACGDSYTAGWINGTATNEDYSWPKYMSIITGAEYVNCGHSGTDVLTWPSAARGLPKAQTAGHAQAYIIGLMINDLTHHVPVGTTADIGDENPTTYYGGMAKIIRDLHAISPNAHIFVQTCPDTNTGYTPYNQAVRDIVTAYAATYKTHLLDLYEYRNMYTNASLTGDALLGHYTAIGYQQFAEILTYIMSEYINTHISDFQDVYSIPTT